MNQNLVNPNDLIKITIDHYSQKRDYKCCQPVHSLWTFSETTKLQKICSDRSENITNIVNLNAMLMIVPTFAFISSNKKNYWLEKVMKYKEENQSFQFRITLGSWTLNLSLCHYGTTGIQKLALPIHKPCQPALLWKILDTKRPIAYQLFCIQVEAPAFTTYDICELSVCYCRLHYQA
jgi:hypothetical protein